MKRIVLLLCLLTGTAGAMTTDACRVESSGWTTGSGNWTLGYEFSVSSPITVTHLGMLDWYNDGLSGASQVGVWDTNATLLASATVPAGTAADLIVTQSNPAVTYYYKALAAPLVLGPGAYVIAGQLTTVASSQIFGYFGGVTWGSGITWLNGRAVSGSTFAYPGAITNTTGNSYMGPQFRFISAMGLQMPQSRSVYQRNGQNVGAVVVSGTCDAGVDRIEARAVTRAGYLGTDTDWVVLATTPGTTFSNTLAVLGGWYDIEVRVIQGAVPVFTSRVERVGVGDIFITAGQSNSANHGAPVQSAQDDRVNALNLNTLLWQKANDPQPYATGTGGSPWPNFGDQLAVRSAVPVGIVAVGVGGTSVDQWVPGTGTYYPRITLAISSCKPYGGARAILWHQGESDSLNATPAATYASRLNSVITQSRVDAGTNVPWGVALASWHPTATASNEAVVIVGQWLVITNTAGVFKGAETDEFHNRGWLSDTVHFNDTGLKDHGRQWADAVWTNLLYAALIWDCNGNSPANPADGGGEWNTASNRWSNGATDTAWISGGNVAIFGNGNGTAGSVTVDGGGITVGGLIFNAPGSGAYTIAGGTVTLAGSSTFAVNADATISSPIAGSGAGLAKTGPATLVLAGANTYSGPTIVSSGCLLLGASASLQYTPVLSLSTGTTFDVSSLPGYTIPAGQVIQGDGTVNGSVSTILPGQLRPGGSNMVGTLTVTTNLTLAVGTNTFDLASATCDLINVGGTLTTGGGRILVNMIGLPSNGTYRLVNYGTVSGDLFNATPICSTSHKTVALNQSITGQVDLVISGQYGNLVWRPAVNGNWDIGVSSNWFNTNTSGRDVFFIPDEVTFDDTGAATNTVTIGAPVSPAFVTVNASSNYVFSGSGGISGACSLVKSGSGTLSLAGRNSFTGALTVNGGVLRLPGSDNTSWLAGNPNVVINNGGVMAFSGYNTFGLNLASMPAVTVNAGGTVLSSGFVTCFNNLTLNGATISINGNDNYTAAWGSFGFGGTTTATGNSVINVTAGNGSIGYGNGNTPVFTIFTPGSSDTLTIAAVIQGAVSVVKQGAGTLTLAGNNTYSGTTTISGGVVTLSGSWVTASAASPVVAVNSGTSVCNMVGTYNNTAGGGLTVNAGTLNWSGTGTISGGNSGAVLIGSAGNTGVFNMTGGALNVTYSGGNGFGIGFSAANANGALNLSGGTLSVNGSDVFYVGTHNSTAQGSVTVSDTGYLALGTTGIIFIGGGSSGGGNYGTGVMTVTNGGIINVSASGAFPADQVYLAGYGGSGTFNLGSGGRLTTSRSFGSGGVGVFNWNGGTLQMATNMTGVIAFNSTVRSGGAIIDTAGFNGTISAALLDGGGGGGLTKLGAGTLSLAAQNTFTGPLTVNAGTLKLPGGNNTCWLPGKPNVVINNGGVLAFSSYNTFGLTLAGMPAVTVNSGGTILSSGYVTCFNNLALNGATMSINGNDNYGAVWGSYGFGGTTTATGISTINVLSNFTGTIANGNGNTPVLSINTPGTTDSLKVFPVIQNGSAILSLVKLGEGELTLAGTNTYSGGTTVSNGTLLVNGSLGNSAVTVTTTGRLGGSGVIKGPVVVNGILAPGNAVGTLTISNNLSVAGTAVLAYDLGFTNDSVAVVGNLVLGGILNVTDAGGLGVGTYTLFTYTGALTNNGVTVGSVPFGSSYRCVVTNLPGQVQLAVTLTEFGQWQVQQFGSVTNPAGQANQDPDGDRMSNWDEYLVGTNPSNALSRLVITNASVRNVTGHVLMWPGVSGRVYSVERSTNLIGEFTGILSNLPAMDPVNIATDDFSGTPVFYRIKGGLGQ